MDTLAVQVEYRDVPEPSLEAWAGRIADRLRKALGVGANVVPVAHQTFDRTEFKARRVIDDRDLLRRLGNDS
jgi:phenylacetate-CoA ligase